MYKISTTGKLTMPLLFIFGAISIGYYWDAHRER
jgi:hypothetical protein